MTSEKKHAAWLHKDGDRRLYHGDDVAAAMQAGWKKADGNRANGEPWNPTEEDEIAQLDGAADVIREANERKAEKQAKKDAEAEKASAEAQKNAPEPEVVPDMKVQVVEPKKLAKK